MKKALTFALVVLFFVVGCGGSSSSSGNVTVKMSASGVASSSINLAKIAKATFIETCPVPAPTMDSSDLAAGLDCDNDGGVVRYLSPKSFKVAFKKLTFVKDDGTEVNIIADTSTLALSQVVNITNEVTLDATTIANGTYIGYKAELYYYEITMDLNASPELTDQPLRLFLSDDDFASEGSLGHHQGDIVFLDANGVELGWVGGGVGWTVADLQATRAGIGESVDPETGHARGLFGNTALWDSTSFMQGASQDIYLMEGSFSVPVVVGSGNKTFSFTFDVADSWFFEDFDGNQKFNPCENGAGDACLSNAEWAPVFNNPAVTVE